MATTVGEPPRAYLLPCRGGSAPTLGRYPTLSRRRGLNSRPCLKSPNTTASRPSHRMFAASVPAHLMRLPFAAASGSAAFVHPRRPTPSRAHVLLCDHAPVTLRRPGSRPCLCCGLVLLQVATGFLTRLVFRAPGLSRRIIARGCHNARFSRRRAACSVCSLFTLQVAPMRPYFKSPQHPPCFYQPWH